MVLRMMRHDLYVNNILPFVEGYNWLMELGTLRLCNGAFRRSHHETIAYSHTGQMFRVMLAMTLYTP